MTTHAHLNDQKQLVTVNAAASVNIVEFEVPAKLLLHSTFENQAQSCYILHEINKTILQRNTTQHCRQWGSVQTKYVFVCVA